MITDEDRLSLINYRLQQSKETVALAQFLIDSNHFSVAVNRIYYGMFYALTALALELKFITSKHNQLIGWFNKKFILTGVISPKYGKILKSAYQNRTRGDYDAFIIFEMEEVLQMHA